jgi:hypothetical protein
MKILITQAGRGDATRRHPRVASREQNIDQNNFGSAKERRAVDAAPAASDIVSRSPESLSSRLARRVVNKLTPGQRVRTTPRNASGPVRADRSRRSQAGARLNHRCETLAGTDNGRDDVRERNHANERDLDHDADAGRHRSDERADGFLRHGYDSGRSKSRRYAFKYRVSYC